MSAGPARRSPHPGLRWRRRRERAREAPGLRDAERQALTRELHDLVTHHLSTVTLQVMSYLDVTEAEELRSILAKVNVSVRAALAELRQLARLQDSGPTPGRPGAAFDELGAPVPLADVVDRCAARLSEAGFDVVVALDPAGQRRVSIETTLSQVLEVATDNILCHAPARSSCTISVQESPDRLLVRITSPLTAARSVAGRSGPNLRRLRERVDLSGGSFWAGPSTTADQGAIWLVTVALPR